jgi:hypothetical protein
MLQIPFERVEALLPELPIAGDPVSGRLQRLRADPADVDAALFVATQKARVLENAQVPGDRGQRDRKGARELHDRGLTQRQTRQHRASGGIGEGPERSVQRLLIVNH